MTKRVLWRLVNGTVTTQGRLCCRWIKRRRFVTELRRICAATMSGAKHRMRNKKMRDQPSNVTFSSQGWRNGGDAPAGGYHLCCETFLCNYCMSNTKFVQPRPIKRLWCSLLWNLPVWNLTCHVCVHLPRPCQWLPSWEGAGSSPPEWRMGQGPPFRGLGVPPRAPQIHHK